MKSFRKYLTVFLALALALSMTMTVYGATGNKTMYLMTRQSGYGYKDNTIDTKDCTKYKYDKNGLLKSVQYSDSYGQSTKGTFVYNKKKQAIKMVYREYYKGVKREQYCYKYSYNKNGYINKIKFYWIDNGRYNLFGEYRLIWNKKGQLTKYKILDDKGKTESITYYKYNKEGQLVKMYYSDSPTFREWTYDGNTGTEIVSDDKTRKNIDSITYDTFKHGDIVKETVYSGEDAKEKSAVISYGYKKTELSSKYRKLARKQQACLPYMGWW